MKKTLATWQGWFYIIQGLWPIVHIQSFMLVSGPKTDQWLVKTVGGLIFVIGFVFCLAAYRKHISLEIILLGVGTPAVLAIIDIWYVSISRISPVYLLDAVVEILIILLWVVASKQNN
jgi:hypothetical protein